MDKVEEELEKLKSRGIPTCLEKLDLKQLGLEGQKLQEKVCLLLSLLEVADWDDLYDKPDLLEVSRLSGALTNCVFIVKGPPRAAVSTASSNSSLSLSMPNPDEEMHLQMQPRTLILRVYGIGVDSFLNRSRELYWLCRLSDMRLGPKLLGAFANGRLEEYFPSRTLGKEDLRDRSINCNIARELAKLHFRVRPSKVNAKVTDGESQLIDGAYPHHKYDSEIWSTLKRWFLLADESASYVLSERPELKEKLDLINLEQIKQELKHVKSVLLEKSKGMSGESGLQVNLKDTSFGLGTGLVVFCHNDTQYGNLLSLKTEANSNLPFLLDNQRVPGSTSSLERILVVDYEYSGMNYRGFDIGNHFIEWCADYHSKTPHLMRWDRYPSKEQRKEWLEDYLECWYNLCYQSSRMNISAQSDLLLIADSSVNILQEETALSPPPPVLVNGISPIGMLWSDLSTPTRAFLVALLENEVACYGLLSHIFWSLWGVMQASKSEIDFDYLGYALDRITEFRKQLQTLSKAP